jgi:Na+-transporting methylmalonyl-CoA/oxaloacetate decarboxylase gamma subunit
MPDTNVLQLATLVVLLLVLLVLVVLTQTMSRIEKSLSRALPEADSAPEPEPKAQAEMQEEPEPVTTKKRSRRSRRKRGKVDDGVALEAGGLAAAAEAYAAPNAQAAAQGEPGQQSQVPVATAADHQVQSHPLETAAAEEAAARVAQSPSSLRDLPQDEPFERDGRWWFVRGDELLVYDEGTGQWTPGDPSALGLSGASQTQARAAGQEASHSQGAQQPGGQGATSEMPAVSGSYQSHDPAGTAPSSGQEQTAEGGFWKCPSCGAVNGSTSPTCRMCFTPRS